MFLILCLFHYANAWSFPSAARTGSRSLVRVVLSASRLAPSTQQQRQHALASFVSRNDYESKSTRAQQHPYKSDTQEADFSFLSLESTWETQDSVDEEMEGWPIIASSVYTNGSHPMNASTVTDTSPKDPVDEWTEVYELWMQAAQTSLQNVEKKRKSLEKELEKAKSIEATVKRANLITSNMYMFTPGILSASITDWETGEDLELTLDPSFHTAAEEADFLFRQARKIKRGSLKVRELLDQTVAALDTITEIINDFSKDNESKVNESFVRLFQSKLRQSSLEYFEPPKPIDAGTAVDQSQNRRNKINKRGSPSSNLRKLQSTSGNIIWVGRNQRGNEYLSLSLAKENDVWLHARGTPGAHVLIPQRRGSPEITEECLQLAANIAVFFSDSRNEVRADVTVTSPKHIVKPKGAPLGAVHLRQEDRVVVGFPLEAPMQLRAVRAESGRNHDEYRTRDKTRNRKRTTATLDAAAAKAKRNPSKKQG